MKGHGIGKIGRCALKIAQQTAVFLDPNGPDEDQDRAELVRQSNNVQGYSRRQHNADKKVYRSNNTEVEPVPEPNRRRQIDSLIGSRFETASTDSGIYYIYLFIYMSA